MFAFFMPASALRVGASIAPYLSLAMFAVSICVFAPQQVQRNKRTFAAALLVVLTLATGVALYASDGDLVLYRDCSGLGPGDALYWIRSCWAL